MIDDLPPPTDSQLRLRVVAAGLHNVVRWRAAGNHFSAHTLPHVPGVDCIGIDESTGKAYYAFTFADKSGTFSEYINIDKISTGVLPDDFKDYAALAANLNPVMSSWMALTSRVVKPPAGFTVLILGATSASGGFAVQASKYLGAGKVIGAARNEKSLQAIEGLDD